LEWWIDEVNAEIQELKRIGKRRWLKDKKCDKLDKLRKERAKYRARLRKLVSHTEEFVEKEPLFVFDPSGYIKDMVVEIVVEPVEYEDPPSLGDGFVNEEVAIDYLGPYISDAYHDDKLMDVEEAAIAEDREETLVDPQSKERREERKAMANKEMKDKIDNHDIQMRSMREVIEGRLGSLDESQNNTNAVVTRLEQRLEEVLRALQQQPPHRDDPPRREPRRHDEHADRTPSPRREDRYEQRRAHEQEKGRRRERCEHEEDFDQRSQASTYRERPKPDKPRFVMSIFTDSDPEAWLNRISQYFELNETDSHDRVRYATFYLDGEANVWWQWLSRIYRRRQQVITLLILRENCLLDLARPITIIIMRLSHESDRQAICVNTSR
ncbi:Unknown protein, partial [Striga hermonthica]